MEKHVNVSHDHNTCYFNNTCYFTGSGIYVIKINEVWGVVVSRDIVKLMDLNKYYILYTGLVFDPIGSEYDLTDSVCIDVDHRNNRSNMIIIKQFSRDDAFKFACDLKSQYHAKLAINSKMATYENILDIAVKI